MVEKTADKIKIICYDKNTTGRSAENMEAAWKSIVSGSAILRRNWA